MFSIEILVNSLSLLYFSRLQSKKSLKFKIKPNTLDDAILVYTAESEKAYGDYFAVIVKDGHPEVRYSVGGSKS